MKKGQRPSKHTRYVKTKRGKIKKTINRHIKKKNYGMAAINEKKDTKRGPFVHDPFNMKKLIKERDEHTEEERIKRGPFVHDPFSMNKLIKERDEHIERERKLKLTNP